MDLVLTIVFFLCATLAVAGAVGAALSPVATWRLLGLLALAVGTAGVLASLSAGFAAVVALVCLGASALLLGSAAVAAVRDLVVESVLSAQVGGAAAALLLVLLLVVAIGGSFQAAGHVPPAFDLAGLGRTFFGRDALALEAVGATLTAGLAVGALARRRS